MKKAILAALAATLLGGGAAQAQDPDAKWFVLRHDQTSDCWSALMIQMNGEYHHAFARIAGGPYATKAEALDREKALENEGTCRTAT